MWLINFWNMFPKYMSNTPIHHVLESRNYPFLADHLLKFHLETRAKLSYYIPKVISPIIFLKNKEICMFCILNKLVPRVSNLSSKNYIHWSFSRSTRLYTAADFLILGVRSGNKYNWRICRAFKSLKLAGDKIFVGCFPNACTITSAELFRNLIHLLFHTPPLFSQWGPQIKAVL